MKLKIGVVGPEKSGKTTISNIIGSDQIVESNSPDRAFYRPTNSIRIIEFPFNSVEVGKKHTVDLDVQLWEIGGNPRLKAIWPGVQSDLDGIIIVYNYNDEEQIRETSAFNMHFVLHSPNPQITPPQCLIIGNNFNNNDNSKKIPPPKIIGVSPKVRHVVVNVDDEPNTLKEEFASYIRKVADLVYDKEKTPAINQANNNYIKINKASKALLVYPTLSQTESIIRKKKSESKKALCSNRKSLPPPMPKTPIMTVKKL